MALQVALSQLRHSKEASVKRSDENQRVSILYMFGHCLLLIPIFTRQRGVLYLD